MFHRISDIFDGFYWLFLWLCPQNRLCSRFVRLWHSRLMWPLFTTPKTCYSFLSYQWFLCSTLYWLSSQNLFIDSWSWKMLQLAESQVRSSPFNVCSAEPTVPNSDFPCHENVHAKLLYEVLTEQRFLLPQVYQKSLPLCLCIPTLIDVLVCTSCSAVLSATALFMQSF